MGNLVPIVCVRRCPFWEPNRPARLPEIYHRFNGDLLPSAPGADCRRDERLQFPFQYDA